MAGKKNKTIKWQQFPVFFLTLQFFKLRSASEICEDKH